MKKKALSAVVLAAVLAVNGAAGLKSEKNLNGSVVCAASDTNDDWLHAKGSRLYDKDGNEVWLTGANWFGFNCTENVPHYLWSGDIDDMVRDVADHGINVLRIPVSTELFYSWMIDDPLPISSVNPNDDPAYSINVDLLIDGKVANSRQTFDVLLAKCKKYGVKMFVDIHSQDSNNAGHMYGPWYGLPMTNYPDVTVDTDLWIDTIAWVANEYKNDDTLLGFDLKNEPHSVYGGGPVDAIWDDSNAANNWKKAAEDCANAILAKNPNALILIEGVEGFEGHGAWWGGNLRGVEKYPVTPASGTSQIIYSPHDYGPVVSQQTWFNKDFTEQTLLDDYWYDTWAYLVEKDMNPLLIGEWGGRIHATVDEEKLLSTASGSMDDVEKNVKWLILLRNYMIQHHVNHTFWCLNDDSGDTGGLWKSISFGPSTGTVIEWDELKYKLFEPSLWQTQTSGKYIGLDHQTALGKNGISLSDFYSNYASSEGSNIDGGTKSQGGTGPVAGTTATSQTTTAVVPTGTTTSHSSTTSSTTSGSARPDNIRYGDTDCNGAINVLDAVLLARVASEAEGVEITQEGKLNSDVTGDGLVKVDDLTKLLQYLAKAITEEELKP